MVSSDNLTIATIIGSLGGDALLGLIVITLAAVVVHLYKQQTSVIMERQTKQIKSLEDIKTELRENTLIAKANLESYKENNSVLLEFMRKHCDDNTMKLEEINNKTTAIIEDIRSLKPWERFSEVKTSKTIKE